MYSIFKAVVWLAWLPLLSACDVTVASPTSQTLSIQDQSFISTTSSTEVTGTLYFEAGRTRPLEFSVSVPPEFGEVAFSNTSDGLFEYELVDLNGLSGDNFTVAVSDGQNTETALVSISIADTTAPLISARPLDGAAHTAIDTDIVITSDDPLRDTTLTVQSTDGLCSGSVQLSANNFASCIGLNEATVASLATEFSIVPKADLTIDTEYKIKITDAVENYFDLPVTETIQTFSTFTSGLVINEVGSSYYANAMRWFELYNGTSATVNLSNYVLKSRDIDKLTSIPSNLGSFTLPSVTLGANQYAIVRAQSWTTTYSNTDSVIYINDGNKYPFWNENGFLELIETTSGNTVDLVVFGQTYLQQGTGVSWLGSPATMESNPDSFGKSIGRNANHADTNAATDWQAYNPGTYGAVNDVECATDNDADMIPDCNEATGKTFSGMPLFDWGARNGTTDIFIEVDYMASTDEGIIPRKEALDKVVAAFASKGINVHFDVGDLFDQSPGLNPAMYDLGGGNEVPFNNGMTFSPSNGEADFHDYKDAYFDSRRLQFFHYMIMANSQNFDGSSGSSGLAEIASNDILITLGNWGLNSDNTAATNRLINFQAGTIMHELGHNLGLLHGGGDNDNYKPNYLSVMNYEYQLMGLPEIGNNEADRMHDRFGNSCKTMLINGPSDDYNNFVISYSDGSSLNLNEAALDETGGLRRTGSGNVDFNCNGSNNETSVAFNINGEGGNTTLADHNDWGNLVTDFGGLSNTSNHGARQAPNTPSKVITWPTKIVDDRSAPFIRESLYRPQD